MWKLIYVIRFLIAALGLTIGVLGSQSSRNIQVQLVPEYIPGAHFNRESCETFYQLEGFMFCSASTAYDNVYLSVNLSKGIITHASYHVPNSPLESYIELWGTPTGIYADKWLAWVYFGNNRYVLVARPKFSPSSNVDFVGYTLEPDHEIHPWRGFNLQEFTDDN